MTTEIVWADAPPESASGRPKDTWFADNFEKLLSKKPGKWARILVGPRNEVQAKAATVRGNHSDGFEITTRKDPDNPELTQLWVRAKPKAKV